MDVKNSKEGVALFANAKFMGPHLRYGYKTGQRYDIAFRRENGEIHIMHLPTATTRIVYNTEVDFLNDWHSLKEAPPFPESK